MPVGSKMTLIIHDNRKYAERAFYCMRNTGFWAGIVIPVFSYRGISLSLPGVEDLYSYRMHGYEKTAGRSDRYHPEQLSAGFLQQFLIPFLRKTY